MKIYKFLIPIIFPFLISPLWAQEQEQGSISGNFEFNGQYYQEDSLIDAEQPDEQVLSNGFLNIIYNRGRFSAGVRYESYLNPLLGFPSGYKGQGIPYRYATYRGDQFQITAGNFYEQFGSGLVLRTYNAPALGYDNSLDGFRINFKPTDGVWLKVIWGKQRNFFELGEGIVRGGDIELSLTELLASPDNPKPYSLLLGGSVVSKFQEDDRADLVLPENVTSTSARANFTYNGLNLQAEYAHKINDPSFDNGYIYHTGKALLASASYSTKGFGITYGVKAIDNMSFRSDRDVAGNNLFINYIPALNRQHTYNLAASFYPYAVQPNGEAGHQLDVLYTFQRGTLLGGKYGTYLSFNTSEVYDLEKIAIPDSLDEGLQGYERTVFKPGKERFFRDYNLEIRKKINSRWNVIYNYVNLFYNMSRVQGLEGRPNVFASIHIMDLQYKLTKKNALRLELQHMKTDQDQGDWASGILEYTVSPKWFFSIFDQWNYGNSIKDLRVHYLIGSVGYIKDSFRITANYGKQRAGIFCVGGICRTVPASSGFSLTVSGSF
ncbi:MAG: DUF6029 family protein [Luteibaculum sp.]